MNRLASVVVLLAVAPVVALEDPLIEAVVPQQFQPVFPMIGPSGAAGSPDATYKAPSIEGPVVELLDEGVEPLFPILNNDFSSDNGQIAREDRDVFAGVEAVRITQVQKFRNSIPGWSFNIVEKPKAAPGPKAAGEYRYLRFAWKKVGGTGIMIQLHGGSNQWNHRFFAGRNSANWQPSISVSDKLPTDWEVVTRDIYKEFGAFTLTGFALTAMDGNGALFDHILLGRTIEDLDKATAAALGKVKPAVPLAGKERDALWADLLGTDHVKAGAAIRAFLATAPDQVAFIRENLREKAPEKELTARITKLVANLDADDFDAREAATEDLIKLGAPVIDSMQSLATSAPADEVRYRAKIILKRLNASGTPLGKAGRMARVVRILERAGTKDARELLAQLAAGEFGPDVIPDAKLALARLPK